MKVIRKILVFFLGLFLSGLISAFLLSFAIKNVIQEELLGGVIKENFIPVIAENSQLNQEEQEIVKSILEDKEVKKIFNNMMDEIIITMGNGEGEISQETLDSVFNYIIENKDKIEKATGEKIDINELEELKKSQEYQIMSEEITSAINDSSNDLDDTSRSAIKTYTYIVSNDFRILILGCMIIDLLLIALVQWSLYNWLSTFGKALTSSGLTLIVLYFGMNYLINKLLIEYDITLNINTSFVFVMGIICIFIGIILIIIRRIIHKIVTNKKNNQEIEINAVS